MTRGLPAELAVFLAWFVALVGVCAWVLQDADARARERVGIAVENTP